MPKQVHSAVKRALHGRWPAPYRQSERSLYLMVDSDTSRRSLLLAYHNILSVFLFGLLYECLEPLSSLLED